MEYRHTVWPDAQMVYTSNGKVAGTSIKTAFLESFMPDVPRKSPHSADQPYINVWKQHQISTLYPTYLHVAGVRDPYDRMVSFFTDKIEGTIKGSGMNDRLVRLGFRRPMTFAETVALACSLPDEHTDPHLRSQSSNVLGPDGELLADLLVRFEQLEDDWALLTRVLAARTGVQLASLGRRRVSVRRSSDEYYDDTTRALVAERYRSDFEKLGYPTNPASSGRSGLGDDPAWTTLGGRTGFTMLDLTSADPDRAGEVRRRGGRYLAPLRFGAPGQLNHLEALESGRLPESAFDVLVITAAQLTQRRSTFHWLHERFTANGRTIIVTPDSAATRAWKAPITTTDGGSFPGMAIVGSIQRAVNRYGWREAARRVPNAVERRVRSKLHRGEGTPAAAGPGSAPARPLAMPKLAPAEALRENGYVAVRQLFTEAECAEMARELKDELGVTSAAERTSTDAVNRFATARKILLDDRVLKAVGAALGDDFRFLQVADLQYNHDHVHWHRDSPYRDAAGGHRRDWDESVDPYRVAKLIVYLESDNAGMGILPGSHLVQDDMDAAHVRKLERAGDYTVIGLDNEPNRRLGAEEQARPLAWRAGAGDALIFDERLYHCGRRVEEHRVIHDQEGTKLTLSFVFGLDNAHSARMYSYFRYARAETHYRDLPPDLAAELERRGLVLSTGWRNYFETAPEELRGAYLRDASKMDDLIREFAGQSSG
jgi:hypothetical protein